MLYVMPPLLAAFTLRRMLGLVLLGRFNDPVAANDSIRHVERKRPKATARNARSAALLSISRRPSSAYRVSASQRPSAYFTAAAVSDFCDSLVKQVSHQTRSDSSNGRARLCRISRRTSGGRPRISLSRA